MANLLDLFSVLDSWDEEKFPQILELSPDPVIKAANYALAGQGDLKSALKDIEEQIVKTRSMLRATRFDLIQL